MKLSVLYKHQIIMREQGKPERMMGNFISFNDSQNFGKVASTIFINGFRSVRDVGDLSQCDTFLFGFDPAKEYNKELIKFHGWLSMNAQKAAVIILDKHQSHAIIIPALYDDEAALKAVGFKSGFICKVYENRNPDKKPVVVPDEPFYDPSSVYGSSSSSVPSFNNPPSSSSYNPTITRAPSIDYTSASSYSYLNPTTLGSLGSMANPPSISAPPIVPVAVSVAAATSNLTAEDHYNKLKRSKETRHQSQLFHMRNLNNFTKAELIEEAIQLIASQPPPSSSAQRSRQTNRRGCTVLELACGKGGDIMKWMKNSYAEITRYVGIDIAENSIKEFVERLTKRPDNLSERVIIEKLIVGNLNQDSLISSSLLTHSWLQHGLRSEWKQMIPLQSSDAFDIISCQFAMHYMFGTAKSVKHFFTEVSRHLNESGLYIATTIDYRILVHYIMKAKYGPMESAMKNTTHQVITSSPLETTMSTSLPTNYDTAPGFKSKEVIKDSVKYLALQFYNEFQKLLLQIELKQETVDRLLGRLSNNNADEDDWFGVEYNFILHDSDEEAAVNSPEFIVPIFTTHFQEILYQEKLEIMKIQNFHDFIIEKFDNDNSRDRMNKMEVFNVNGTISEAEWLIARLYTVLILKKVSNIAEKPKKVSVVPSLVPPEPNPISVVPDLQNPPRLRPSSPKYPPRRIGALIDPKDPVVLNHQARFANLLTTTTNGNAAKKRTHDALEDQEEIRENIEETNEEDEEDFEFLEKVREKAIELVGGSEQWDELPDEEIERFITKAKTLLKSSQSINGKAPWKVYPPRSPDHPPPQLRNKMETVAEEENEDGDEDDSIAKMQRIRSRAVELAGGEEAWENLDDECCDDFFAVARKQLEQERNKI